MGNSMTNLNYSSDAWGNISTEGAAYIIGDGHVTEIAKAIASSMIAVARMAAEDCPVEFVTGNSYMPPLRAYNDADKIWNCDNGYASSDPDAHVAVWEFFVEELEGLLSEANVYLGSPDYDNSLYVVDLARFEYVENTQAKTLNDEWELIEKQEEVIWS
jgi:hypothetical protein